ncbi:unnamed protein product [Adineta steineri]|uniref:Uncharacterized protein n=1 Tax=Adineta steineri TaxID=433720 RepID=A0A819V1Z1_9BILA|nr:unnamed protein product [Adineta steineri]CAF3721257.1 unnamed protein product [Adineta steineri]CAF4103911.1 unnamed protein product [Adineta steineri]
MHSGFICFFRPQISKSDDDSHKRFRHRTNFIDNDVKINVVNRCAQYSFRHKYEIGFYHARTTKCPPPTPCSYCQPYGNIDFTVINQCPSCACNPCQSGQPFLNITCGQGANQCAQANGVCKVNAQDKVYCCPNERADCCPPPPSSSTMGACFATCTYDTDCSVGKKCCGNCPGTCQNATLT